jgi:hypothetical protein
MRIAWLRGMFGARAPALVLVYTQEPPVPYVTAKKKVVASTAVEVVHITGNVD